MTKRSGGEFISHCASVRLRINGAGNIKTSLFDLGNNNFRSLTSKAMNDNVTGRTITVGSNFKSEAIMVEIRTTEIDEVFTVNRIISYLKPTATSYPK